MCHPRSQHSFSTPAVKGLKIIFLFLSLEMEDEDTIDVFQSQTGGCFWSGNYFSGQNFAILGKWFDLLCLNDIAILRNTWKLLNIKFDEKTIFLDLRMCEKYCFSVWFYLQELQKQKATENVTFSFWPLSGNYSKFGQKKSVKFQIGLRNEDLFLKIVKLKNVPKFSTHWNNAFLSLRMSYGNGAQTFLIIRKNR